MLILTKLFEMKRLEKYGVLFQLQRTGNIITGTLNKKLYFSVYKNHVLLRGFLSIPMLRWNLISWKI